MMSRHSWRTLCTVLLYSRCRKETTEQNWFLAEQLSACSSCRESISSYHGPWTGLTFFHLHEKAIFIFQYAYYFYLTLDLWNSNVVPCAKHSLQTQTPRRNRVCHARNGCDGISPAFVYKNLATNWMKFGSHWGNCTLTEEFSLQLGEFGPNWRNLSLTGVFCLKRENLTPTGVIMPPTEGISPQLEEFCLQLENLALTGGASPLTGEFHLWLHGVILHLTESTVTGEILPPAGRICPLSGVTLPPTGRFHSWLEEFFHQIEGNCL